MQKEFSVKIETLSLTIGYEKTVEELSSRYNFAHENITNKVFKSDRIDTVELRAKLICISQPLSTEEVIIGLEKLNLRPANIQELLTFGLQYPEKLQNNSITGMGTEIQIGYMFQGYYWYLPSIVNVNGDSFVSLNSWSGKTYPESSYFLAFDR